MMIKMMEIGVFLWIDDKSSVQKKREMAWERMVVDI
jgi:hypothetical protein